MRSWRQATGIGTESQADVPEGLLAFKRRINLPISILTFLMFGFV